jgi:type II secretory pathway pseudopilin PulG
VIKRLRQELGYTVIELIMVMAVLGFVVGGITTAFVSGSKAQVDLSQRFVGQQNARLALASLRSSIHTACSATVPQTGRLYLYPYYSIQNNVVTCGANPTTVWCTGTSAYNAVRYNLFQNSAASCASPPVGKLWADYLTTNAIFTVNTPGTGQRASVTVTLTVNTNKASSATTTVDRYQLTDTIVLRNGPTGA